MRSLCHPPWLSDPRRQKETPPETLKEKLDKGEKVLVIDVRSDEDVKTGSIPGAVHIPMEELEARIKDVPKDVQSGLHLKRRRAKLLGRGALQEQGIRDGDVLRVEGLESEGLPDGDAPEASRRRDQAELTNSASRRRQAARSLAGLNSAFNCRLRAANVAYKAGSLSTRATRRANARVSPAGKYPR